VGTRAQKGKGGSLQVITDEYRKLNQELHERNKDYGVSGKHYLNDVVKLIRDMKTRDVLDYGCGKSTLAHNLPFTIKQYDPAVPQFAELPRPADLVVCTDVLEHIEPELLDNVLAHIASLTKIKCYANAATVCAAKTLADGRNAHLTIENAEWWIERVKQHFDVGETLINEQQVIFVLTPKKGE
jgi:hypothetical protein